MGWVQALVAVPVAFVFVALVHDFLAGLGEERLWSDPAREDPENFRNREAAAKIARRVTTVTSLEVKPGEATAKVGPTPAF